MVLGGENMIITNEIAKSNLASYSNKNNKISRDIRDGKLFKIVTGLYETDPNTSGYLLASSIYGPSYISFEYALATYGLIPERVYTITCATFDKKKKKQYDTQFGVFTYRDIPSEAYPEEIMLRTEGNYSYQIATAEKALCDKLYTLSPLNNYSNLENMLFNDLRIDIDEFNKLDADKIEKLSKLYHSTNINLLAKYIRRNNNE
jgi:predicted transcriptional regulator of viral defense system